MKKAGSVILIFLLTMQSGGILFFYHLQQSLVQFEMQQQLSHPENVFEKIIVSRSEFHKNRVNSSEVLLDGKMYDIKSIAYTGNKVTLLALHDTEEENILQEIKSFIANSQNTVPIPDHFVKQFSFIYLVPTFQQFSLMNNSTSTVFFWFAETIISSFQKITSPPPELV